MNESLRALRKNGKEKVRKPFVERDSGSGKDKLHLRMEGQAHPIYYDLGLDHTILSMSLYEPHYPHIAAFRQELAAWRFYYFEPRTLMREDVPAAEVEAIGPRGEDLAPFINALQMSDSKKMDIQRCYELLELKGDASLHDVRQAYRDISDVWHPDRFSHNYRLKKKAEEKLKDINRAYVMLVTHLDGEKRIKEDKKESKDSQEKQKSSKVQKGVSLEDFFEFGTFFTLRMWSGLSSSLNRLIKKSDQSG